MSAKIGILAASGYEAILERRIGDSLQVECHSRPK